MPPKAKSLNKAQKPQGPTKEELEAINNYLRQKPDFENLIREAKANTHSPAKKVETDYDRKLREAVKQVYEQRSKDAAENKKQGINMPVLPKEDGSDSSM